MTAEEEIRLELSRRRAECARFAAAAAEKNLHNTMEANELLVSEYSRLIKILDNMCEESTDKDSDTEIQKAIEWSEDDKRNLEIIRKALVVAEDHNLIYKEQITLIIDWIKSLKNRFKEE